MTGLKNILDNALKKGLVKETAYENILAWLRPSFAGVEAEGVKVGDFIENLIKEEKWGELNDRFFILNSFGTAGVRGKLSIGSACFNSIILGLGVEAHSRYIEEEYKKEGKRLLREKAVVLAYDSRTGSYNPETEGPGYLVKEAAGIYAAYGIKAYIFNSPAPTPELSFAISESAAVKPFAGGVFTASHNPSSDNGFKPYDFYGGQIVHERVQKIARSIKDYNEVKRLDYREAMTKGLIEIVGPDIDGEYIEKENQLGIWLDEEGHFLTSKISPELKVVFSSLNGTSQRLIEGVLKRRGFNTDQNFFPVKIQFVPDGAFSTCPKPNPEEKQALFESILLAEKTEADILIATDPDGDRLGVGIRLCDDEKNLYNDDKSVQKGYYLLSGNQQLGLLTDYILSQLKERDSKLPLNSLVSKSIVSSDLVKSIADRFGVMTIEPQVGFKYIGQRLSIYADRAFELALENEGEDFKAKSYADLSRNERIRILEQYSLCFLFGGEESYGSLAGDYVKDKDAVTISVMFVEMAGFYKKRGKTITQRLEEIYAQYGYAEEETVSLTFEGAKGSDVIKAIMSNLRKNPFSEISGKKVIACIDHRNPATGANRCAFDPSGKILFEDTVPENPAHHSGYTEIEGISVPLFWAGDYSVAGDKARLPFSDMLMFVLEGGSKIVARPSGTEPKIKFYFLIRGSTKKSVKAFFEGIKREIIHRTEQIQKNL